MTDADINKMVQLAAKAYVDEMGLDKWKSLTEQQQHDVIMYVLTDICNHLASEGDQLFMLPSLTR